MTDEPINDTDCSVVCEKIASDKQLMDTQQAHVEECTECRAFLEQHSSLKKNLCKLSVPGISEGDISSRVMKEIQLSKPFTSHHFKLSRHLGTAAAILIVVGMFAVSNNYDLSSITGINSNDKVNNTEMYDAVQNTSNDTEQRADKKVIVNAKMKPFSDSNTETFDSPQYYSKDLTETEKDNKSGSTTAQKPQIMFSKVTDGTAQSETDSTVVSEEQQNVSKKSIVAAQTTESYDPANVESVQEYAADLISQDDLYDAQMPAAIQNDYSYEDILPEAASGGGLSDDLGFDNSNLSSPQNAADGDLDKAQSGFFYSDEAENKSIFSHLNLSSDESDFSSNVEKTNAFAASVFKDAEVLSQTILQQNGITNQMFIQWLQTVDSVSNYSFESIYQHFN